MSDKDQIKIWEYFQGDGSASFELAAGRARFLARRIGRAERVLNIGIGGALFERFACMRGAAVFSVDPDEAAVAKVRRELALGDRARAARSDALPFDDNSMDCVVMSEVLEHLSDEELNRTIQEVYRVLRPHGRFLVTVPHVENLTLNVVVCPRCGTKFHRWGHLQSFDLKRLTGLLATHNFRIRRSTVRAFPNWRRAGIRSLFKSALAAAAGRLGVSAANPSIYVEASKQSNHP